MSKSRSVSAEEFQRACRVIPGGVNSPARAFGAVGGHPLWIDRGEGAYLIDVEGNRYIDYIGSWGPLILGHRHPKVIAAIEAALARGTTFGAPTRLETELAERIVACVPSVEKVRMVNSGTEASMSAVRAARGFTGRQRIIKFAGCYHGHVDALLVQAGSAATTLGTPSSPGVPPGCVADTIVLEFNDPAAVESAFAADPDGIAAVILEPVVGNMGLVAPAEGYLAKLRELTQRYGAVLIFDEVMTGFRLSLGGAQQRYGVTPDLTVLGKIVGGGLPCAAYGGRDDIMGVISPSGPVYQAGTLSGNPLAMASGKATIEQLIDESPYPSLEQRSARLADGLSKACREAGIPHSVPRVGSMLTLFFNPDPVVDYRDAVRSNTQRFAHFFWKMLDRGVYWPCSQYEALFVSSAHRDEEIDATIEAAAQALREIATQESSETN